MMTLVRGILKNPLGIALWSVRTFDKNDEKGKPLSRAKDQICRDAVAISAITAKTSAITMMATMMSVPT